MLKILLYPRKILLLLLIGIIAQNCTNKKTELILLGTVHQAIENFNADTLYNILVQLQPDVILFEVDSSFFTDDFEFVKTWDSNENIATITYMENYDVDVRPYDFTGRNEHRINIGSRPTDSKATELLDSLYRTNQLDSLSTEVYLKYLSFNDSLNAFASMGARAFNNSETDQVAQSRQQYQYQELLKIMDQYPVFSNTYHKKSENDSISYAEGYRKASEFWDLRNQTMAKNIMHFAGLYKGKRILVLNGYYHRYYLINLVMSDLDAKAIVRKEYYDY